MVTLHRVVIAIAVTATAAVSACGKDDPDEYAKKQVEDQKPKGKVEVIKVETPVAAGVEIPCEQLIDVDAFTAALEEEEPVTVADNTGSDAEAAAVCSIDRGGEKPDAKEQKKMFDKTGKLGVLPGDELCNVTAYCWKPATPESLGTTCSEWEGQMTKDIAGMPTCTRLIAKGAVDLNSYRFIDEDTGCVLQVRGGPSMNDQAVVDTCARTAADTIGKDQIAEDWTPPEPEPDEDADEDEAEESEDSESDE